MDNSLNFNYYYGIEAEQFSFYKIPKLLIKDARFNALSSDAKILYALLLDRMSLSMKNKWLDKENRVYIYYTIAEMMKDLGCSKNTCIKVMAELDSKKGIGLIEKKRQGLGKPDIIYVKNAEVLESVSEEIPKCEKETSRSSEIGLQEAQTLHPNNTDINNTNINNTVLYPNHIYSFKLSDQFVPEQRQNAVTKDGIDKTAAYIAMIKQNVEYDRLVVRSEWEDKDLYTELYRTICDVVCMKRESIKIAGAVCPYELVKSRFLKLRSEHLQYVLDCIKKVTNSIQNIKAYMITALYNATTTMDHYYTNKVQYNLYGHSSLSTAQV